MKVLDTLSAGDYTKVELVQHNDRKKIVKSSYKHDKVPECLLHEERILRYAKKHRISSVISLSKKRKCRNGVVKLFFDHVPGNIDLYTYLDDISSEKLPSFMTKVHLMRSLLIGLTEMHSKHLVHRDIKSDNILFNPETMETKFIDFDLACTKNLGKFEQCVGTDGYRAPEIEEELFYDVSNQLILWKKADVWSLGMTFIDIAFWDYFRNGFWTDECYELEEYNYDSWEDNFERENVPIWKPANHIFLSIIRYMLRRDWRRRPTARLCLRFLEKHVIEPLREIIGKENKLI